MATLQDMKTLYEQDFAQWCEATIAQLRTRDLGNLDLDNLIEEIDSLARCDRRELKNRSTVLLIHLLNRLYVNSPENFTGWEVTIIEQRKQINNLLADSPSLRAYLLAILPETYQDALDVVAVEYPRSQFPPLWPFDQELASLLTQTPWDLPR
jgi:hypothetical protein